MSIYLDTNIFYNAYSPIEDRFTADWLLNQLSSDFPGVTSEWTIVEMFRALKKQVNLNKIENNDAQVVIDLFLSDIGEDTQKKKLFIIPVKKSYIMAARPFIFNENLYAADAVHTITALQAKVDAFITYDGDFKKLKKIPIINPKKDDFKNSINEIKENYIKKTEKKKTKK